MDFSHIQIDDNIIIQRLLTTYQSSHCQLLPRLFNESHFMRWFIYNASAIYKSSIIYNRGFFSGRGRQLFNRKCAHKLKKGQELFKCDCGRTFLLFVLINSQSKPWLLFRYASSSTLHLCQ